MQFPWQVALILASGCVLLALACLGQTQKKLLVARPFSLSCFLTALWCFLYTRQLLSWSLEEKLLLMQIGFSFLPVLPVVSLEMTYRFVHERKLLRGWSLAAALVIPALTAILAWTMNHSPIFRYNFSINVSDGLPILVFRRGPWNAIVYLYFYALIVWSFLILVRSLSGSIGWVRRARIWFTAARTFPLAFDFMHQLDVLTPRGLNYAPVSLVFTNIVVCLILFGDRTGYKAYVAHSTLVEKIQDLLIVLTSSHQILDMNRAATKALRITREAAVARPVEEIFHEWPQVRDALKGASEEPKQFEHEGRHYELSIVPGDKKEWILWLRDITRLKKAEADLRAAAQAARDAETAKDRYLAMMSHEIRGPLTSVLGFMRLLENTPLDPDQREYVEHVSRNGDNLLAVINDVLDYSKIEAGQMTLAAEPFDLRKEITVLCRGMKLEAQAKHLALDCTIAPDFPALAVGDKMRVGQILRNLLTNAIKFTDSGGIQVHVTAKAFTPAECEVSIQVSDTGIGIAPEEIDRLFRPFSQASQAIRRQYGGTGLGLTIARRFSEMMGGTITVSSEMQKGSTFTCILRLGLSSQLALSPSESTETAAGDPQEPLRILIVDDQPVNRRLLQIILTKLDHQTTLAADGAECLELLKSIPFDVVILDVEMPGMDGFATARQIRASLPSDPYIVALTAHTSPAIREECLAAGMNDYLAKPFTQRDLKQALANVRMADA